MEKLDLTGEWQFRLSKDSLQKKLERKKLTRWMKAIVPGTVHTDLMSHKLIPDPYYRMNEIDVQWVDTCAWEYKKEFTLNSEWLKFQRIELVAGGLDTYAALTMNGKTIAETDNMFIEHRFDVRKYLKKGKNTLSIVFHSPTERVKEIEKQHGRLLVANEPARVYARKAQYSFGWDWGPKLTTSGIWRVIYLEGRNSVRLKDPFVRTISINGEQAVLECFASVDGNAAHSYKLSVILSGDDRIIESTVMLENNHASVRVDVPQPRLWWPNGYGEPYLYHALFQLVDENNNVLDKTGTHFGIRTVKLLREQDDTGESFIFEINGHKIFSKGANWIPADNFIPRIPNERYEKLLELAAAAHMNTIRVWGGGIYEQEIFYNLCDRLGLMVWQDFMFACGEYPEVESFADNVRCEAEYVVKKLRNNPSIVMWCGNNECEYLFCNENSGRQPDDMKGAGLFRDIIREVCETHDETRPYWRSSPFGAGHPNDESNGNHHQWDVWSNWKDYEQYGDVTARFVTEFGFQAPPHRKTFESVTVKNDRHFQSRVLEHHNKQVEGTERLYRFQAAHYAIKNEYEEFIYRGQLVQAEALKYAVEHWRSRKFKTAGSIFWQLNDCWQVSSWSVIDSDLRPKAAYYYSKRFFAPVLASIHYAAGKYIFRITNDRLTPVDGTIVVDLHTVRGRKKQLFKKQLSVNANVSVVAAEMDVSTLPVSDSKTEYIRVRFNTNNEVIAENRYFFVAPKHFNFPSGKVKLKISREGHQTYSVALTAPVFVKDVQLDFDDGMTVFSDNFFDIDAGERRVVYFASNRSLRKIKDNLSVRWLSL